MGGGGGHVTGWPPKKMWDDLWALLEEQGWTEEKKLKGSHHSQTCFIYLTICPYYYILLFGVAKLLASRGILVLVPGTEAP